MTNSPKELLKEFIKILGKAPSSPSREELSRVVHEDIRWSLPVGTSPVIGKVHEGIDAIADLMSHIFSKIYNADRYKIELQDSFGDDEFAAARFRVIAETVSGAAYDNEYVQLARVQDGKIIEIREFLDTFSAIEQFRARQKS